MNDLDRRLREHYLGQSLPDRRADRLVEMAQLHRRARRPARSVAAATVAAAAAVLILLVGRGEPGGDRVEEMVLREIALNHTADLDLEFVAANLAALADRMERLEFDVAAMPEAASWELLGGRYCSLRGGLAMQARFRDPETSTLVTLYATEATPELAALAPGEGEIDGIHVRLVLRDGVFFAIAESEVPGRD